MYKKNSGYIQKYVRFTEVFSNIKIIKQKQKSRSLRHWKIPWKTEKLSEKEEKHIGNWIFQKQENKNSSNTNQQHIKNYNKEENFHSNAIFYSSVCLLRHVHQEVEKKSKNQTIFVVVFCLKFSQNFLYLSEMWKIRNFCWVSKKKSRK